jgi:hypothetical protein
VAYEEIARNSMLDHLGTEITHLALFTDNAGTVEVTGGSPAYARHAITWIPASAGSMSMDVTLFEVNVPACTVRAIGLMGAVTGGTKYITINVTNETFAAQGIYLVTQGTLYFTGAV